MVKQLRVEGSVSAPKVVAAVLQAKASQRVSVSSSSWKKLGRASGVFTVGLLAAVAAPRDAKAVGYFADNTGNAVPPNGVVCPEYPAKGCYTSWMQLADLDNDGDFDQLWANGGSYYQIGSDNESTVLLNNGAGIFTNVTPTVFGGAANRLRQESTADVDGDGDLDIYQPGGFGADLDKLWIQTTAGVFVNKADTLLPAGLMSHAGSSHLGDLDGDGDVDMLVMDWGIGQTNTVDRAIIYTNDGTGKFTFAGMQNDPAFATATDILPATLPASGNAPPSGGSVLTITNTAAYGSITYWGVRPIDVDLVDVDNDFDLDIMVNHRNGYSRIFLNDGKGHFTDGTNFKLTTSTDGTTQTVTTNWPLKRGPYVYNQEFCDIDEDGDMDMLLDNVGPKPVNNQSWAPGGGTTGTMDVMQLSLNDGHGKFTDDTANRVIGELGGDDNAVKCADFSGDGHYDMVVATLTGRAEKFLLNDGTAHFQMIGDAIPVVNDASLSLDAADLNGDKIMDLVTGSGETNTGIYQNRVYLGGGPSAPDHTPPAFRAIQTPVPFVDTPTVIRFALRDAATSETGQMVKSATVTYTVTGGATKVLKAVWFGGDLFRATIPAQPVNTEVTVTLSAVDRVNLTGTAAPFKFTVLEYKKADPIVGGSGGTANVAGGGGTATGGSTTGGTGGTADAEGGEGGETPVAEGGKGGKSGGTGKGGSTGKGGAGSKAGASPVVEPSGDAGSEDGTAGGTTTTSDDSGGCAISAATPANKSTGAVMLGFGLAMLGLVRRRRNSK